MKVCSTCKDEKALNQFSKNRCMPDGRQNVCKMCSRGYRPDKATVAAYNKQYQEANREAIRIQRQRKYLANRDRMEPVYAARYQGRRDKARSQKLVKQFGITLAQKETTLKVQGGCAICGTDTPGGKGWATDHNHKTGALRGVLCS